MKIVRRLLGALALACLALALGGAMPARASEGARKVVVTVEGQTLGQGFFIEPTVVTFDEFKRYWAERGQTVTDDQITAGGIFSYVLAQNGTPMGNGESVSGPSYMASIQGIEKGVLDVPQFLLDAGVEVDKGADPAGSELREHEYCYSSGWVYAEHNVLPSNAIGGHVLRASGMPYTQDGEGYYVIRLMFTLTDRGFDLGMRDESEEGWAPDYYYRAADKSQLYILYARLSEAGLLGNFPAARSAALSVMNDLRATQDEVDAAYRTLLSQVSAQTPSVTDGFGADAVTYEVGQAAGALAVEASVGDSGTLAYQWYRSSDRTSWTAIDGAIEASYVPPTVAAGTTYYRCEVTNTLMGSASSSARSGVATVMVGKVPVAGMMTSNLPGTKGYAWRVEGQDPLRVGFYGFGYDTPSFQWYRGSAGATSIDEMEPIGEPTDVGATSSTYLPDVSTEYTATFACRIWFTSSDGNRAALDSAVCTVSVVNKNVVVTTEEQLHAMEPNGIYTLGCDIELTEPWTPIANFSGTLDGAGHTISGLDVTVAENDWSTQGAGLFQYNARGAVVKNLGLTGTVASHNNNVWAGAIFGALYAPATISNCWVDVDVVNDGLYNGAGGLVGDVTTYAGETRIENCYATGSVTVDNEYGACGGLVGRVESAGFTMDSCYTTCDTAVGEYGGADGTGWNVYSAMGDAFAAPIPADMDAFLAALTRTGAPFVAAPEGANGGYPVLSWQAPGTSEPEQPEPGDDAELDERIRALADSIAGTLLGSGEDWAVMDMLAFGYSPSSMDIATLRRNAEETATAENLASTDLERVVLSLTASGIDASAFTLSDGTTVDLIGRIAGFERNGEPDLGTVNGYAFALIAYDCGGYEVPADAHWTRNELISYLLGTQAADGGWNLSAHEGRASEVDLTAMVVSALSGYRDRPEVAAAVERAVGFLSGQQLESGGFSSSGVENSNSASMVVIALAAVDIDPVHDARFVKNGQTVLDALLAYEVDGGLGFTDVTYVNSMSSEQGFRALKTYQAWSAGEGAFNVYDLTGIGEPTEPVTVDKSALKRVIADALSLNPFNFTQESWARLAAARAAAQRVYDDDAATQVEVFRVTDELRQAIAALRTARPEQQPAAGGEQTVVRDVVTYYRTIVDDRAPAGTTLSDALASADAPQATTATGSAQTGVSAASAAGGAETTWTGAAAAQTVPLWPWLVVAFAGGVVLCALVVEVARLARKR